MPVVPSLSCHFLPLVTAFSTPACFGMVFWLHVLLKDVSWDSASNLGMKASEGSWLDT